MAQVPLNASYRTTRVWGGTKDHHSALLGGHSTLNTVVLGEGVSKSKYTTYFGHHSSAPAAPRCAAPAQLQVVRAGRPAARVAGAAMVAEVGGYLVLRHTPT